MPCVYEVLTGCRIFFYCLMFKWALPECYHIFLCVYGIHWSFISFSHLILNGELFQSFYTCHYVICRVWQYGHSAAKTRHWICMCELSRKSWVLCRHLLSWNCLKVIISSCVWIFHCCVFSQEDKEENWPCQKKTAVRFRALPMESKEHPLNK